jgi:hypothetical protein
MDTIRRQRDSEAAAKKEASDLKAKLQEIEDRDKTETQKATDKAAKAEERAAAAERTSLQLEVALDKAPEGMSVAQIRKLAKRLTGKDRTELEADAEELFGEFAPKKDDDKKDDEDAKRRPKERLKSGAAPSSEPEETDPKKLAAQVQRRW